MSLADMLKAGEVRRLKAGRSEIRKLLSNAGRLLKDARATTVSSESRLEHAYTAILVCAMAVLRASGYATSGERGRHYVALESLKYTLKKDDASVGYYHRLRQKRHQGIYDGTLTVSHVELDEAVREATSLLGETRNWLKGNFPSLV
jgi:uncharacterized protein (UPF0332 family)